ncbi:MAG: D-alanyl-D-alanine carboxypeptidase [Clostridia bacterium]|nr:D-alanyl-D-alanine carboxypeptidase [Clostridia bacterium]
MKKNIVSAIALFLALWLLIPIRGDAAESLMEAGLTLPTTELSLPCRGAILIEQTTGTVLYEKNADESLPIASVTKIMTLLLTMEAIEKGVLSEDQSISVSENAASMGGSQIFLEPGEVISLHDLLKAVFVSSANDGAVALAEAVSGSVEGFVDAMNQKARELGMKDTVFYNPTGLDDEKTNVASARDVALMSAALLSYEKTYDYTTLWTDSVRDGAFGLSNTNKLIRFYPGATGLKTGYTAKAKFCVSASAERNGLKLCAVVLAGESSAERFRAAKTLLDHGFSNFAYYCPDDLSLPEIPVWGGKAEKITLCCEDPAVLLTKSDAAGLTPVITAAEELFAPVEKGQIVGKISYCKGGASIYEIPLTAAEAVEALDFWDLFFLLCRNFFTGSGKS